VTCGCLDGQSRGVRITVVPSPSGTVVPRRHATVMAVESNTHVIVDRNLTCDVWVAPVHSIEIFTVVEELGVHSTEQIGVVGKDLYDNTFSTLEVRWQGWEVKAATAFEKPALYTLQVRLSGLR
jgi:hypothetical protein